MTSRKKNQLKSIDVCHPHSTFHLYTHILDTWEIQPNHFHLYSTSYDVRRKIGNYANAIYIGAAENEIYRGGLMK